MPNLRISELQYVGNTGYTESDVLPFVSFIDQTGTTSNTTLLQHKEWILSGLTFDFLPLSGGTVTGNTIFTTGLTAQTLFVSAATNPVQFQNLQFNSTDTRILTSDSNGVIRYTNLNNITGLTSADTFTTAFTYNNNTFTLNDNSGRTFNAVINTVTGFTINGNLTVTGNTSLQNLTGRTAVFSSSSQNILTVIGSGNSTTSPLFSVVGSQGELFSITDSLVGSLFSVNDISGLPILDVFSDERILMGSYLAPSLNTTKRLTLTAGTNTVYQIPTSAYTGGFFDYTLMSTGATGARSGSIISIWSGTTTRFNEVTTLDIGSTTGVTFNVDISGANAVLSASASTSGWTLKTIIRSI